MWSTWSAKQVDAYLGDVVRPGNATLVIAGQLGDTDAWTRSVMRYLGGWKGAVATASPAAAPPVVPQARAEKRTLLYDEFRRTQAAIFSTCRLDYAGPQDRAAVMVLEEILRNRVFSDVREAEGLAYSPYAWAWTEFDGTANADVQPEPSNDGAGRPMELLERAWTSVHEIDAATLQRMKLRAARSAGTGLQSIDQRTSAAIQLAAIGSDLAALANFGKAIAGVSADDLRRLTRGCKSSTFTSVIGPVKELEPQFAERKIP